MLLVSTKNQDLRERLHKGKQLTLTRLDARVSSLAFGSSPSTTKMGHRPTARNALLRHNHEISR